MIQPYPAPTLRYACTWIDKEVCKDSFEHGCEVQRTCVLNEATIVTAPTLRELLEAIKARFCLHGDLADFSFEDADEHNAATGLERLDYGQLEDADGGEPSDTDLARWRTGELEFLYACDYTFSIERRQVTGIDAKEAEELMIQLEDERERVLLAAEATA